MTARFYKYQAMGNDMLMLDPRHFQISMSPGNIRLLCDRHFGAGADGICYGPLPGALPQPAMRFFNPDGSEAEKSGNGLRIFARYLWDTQQVSQPRFAIAIGGEIITAHVLDETGRSIAIGMGQLSFARIQAPMVIGRSRLEITQVSMGNPHAVIFTDDLQQIHTLGPVVESAGQFPLRTNVQLVKVLSPHAIQIEIWERGAGYTLASGTCCSAAAGAAVRLGYCQSPIEVQMAGGTAQVSITEDWRVDMVGSVSAVYQAELSPDLQQRLESITPYA